MILATQQDVEDRLRRVLVDPDETDYIDVLLEEASVLVEGYLSERGITYSDGDTIPRAVVIVVSRIVARALTANVPAAQEGATSLQAGQFSVRYGDPVSSSVFLSSTDKKWLRSLVPGMVSVSLVSDRYGS